MPLSYGQIADIARVSLSSVQTSISRFNKSLEKERNGLLLGQLLRMANAIGWEPSMVYRLLKAKGLFPSGKEEIDSLDIASINSTL